MQTRQHASNTPSAICMPHWATKASHRLWCFLAWRVILQSRNKQIKGRHNREWTPLHKGPWSNWWAKRTQNACGNEAQGFSLQIWIEFPNSSMMFLCTKLHRLWSWDSLAQKKFKVLPSNKNQASQYSLSSGLDAWHASIRAHTNTPYSHCIHLMTPMSRRHGKSVSWSTAAQLWVNASSRATNRPAMEHPNPTQRWHEAQISQRQPGTRRAERFPPGYWKPMNEGIAHPVASFVQHKKRNSMSPLQTHW